MTQLTERNSTTTENDLDMLILQCKKKKKRKKKEDAVTSRIIYAKGEKRKNTKIATEQF